MPGGYMGRNLVVDLNSSSISEAPFEEETYRRFIGGYGLGAKFVFESQEAGADPLGAENILGFTTGPLTGTPALFGSRFTVIGKSPLTYMWGDANCGGNFGPYMKFAGADNIYFRGVSDRWVYFLLDNGKAEIRDASHLKGKDVFETQDTIKKECGDDVRVVSIGSAGEMQSLISCIMTDKGRAAARSGLGAVMGSKRLKAVVMRGQGTVPLSDAEGLRKARKRYLQDMKGPFRDLLETFGTSGTVAKAIASGDAPSKNWRGIGEEDVLNAELISGEEVVKLQTKRDGCWQCPVACGGIMKGSAGRFKYGDGAYKPEYETLIAFGSLCLNEDLESIVLANDICNRNGLDTISAGAVIAFAIECFEEGIITKGDTGGIELRWGDPEAIINVLTQIVRREGLGDTLADGVKVAARKLGGKASDFAFHVQGQEVPMHDPKRFIHFGPTYLLDPTPGRHTQGSEGITSIGLSMPSFDRKAAAGRGEARRIASNLMHVINCAGMCEFGYMMLPTDALIEFLSMATGWDLSLQELTETGERILNIRHAFNIREGFKPSQRDMPARLIGRPPLKDGPLAGKTVDIETMVNEYLDAVNWDRESWVPRRQRLEELGLQGVAEQLTGLGVF